MKKSSIIKSFATGSLIVMLALTGFAQTPDANLFGVPVIESTIGVEMVGSVSTVDSIKSQINSSVKKHR